MLESNQLSYYHVIVKGNNSKYIFINDSDKFYYLKLLFSIAKKEKANILAWCIMDNHIHIVVKIQSEKFSTFFRRINIRYSKYYHNKYSTSDHLFRKLKRILINDDEQLLCNIRYVHRNPIKANLVENYADYPWSSYKEYLKDKINPYLKETIDIFGGEVQSFIEFHNVD